LTLAGTPNPQEVDVERIRLWANGHGDRVELIDGYIPLEEVTPIFARARVVVTPYTAGYQSGVIHLAMTMGRAVVTADVGDLGAAVADGETGFVVPPGEPAPLADALERVVADLDLAIRLGAAGRARVMGDSRWERVAEQAEEALEALN
jgi:glycosyltransferase involved in cell wall biosynthesis